MPTEHGAQPGSGAGVRVRPETLRAFAAAVGPLGDRMHAIASAPDARPDPLLPVFGSIGAEFLTAFGHTASGHHAQVGRVSTVLADMALCARMSADAYEDADSGAGHDVATAAVPGRLPPDGRADSDPADDATTSGPSVRDIPAPVGGHASGVVA